jgi:hypothetical protein
VNSAVIVDAVRLPSGKGKPGGGMANAMIIERL